jgi:hypothetical protein
MPGFILDGRTLILHGPVLGTRVVARFGVGSRNNFIAETTSDLKAIYTITQKYGEFITQDLLTGAHWNVDVLVDEGRFITAIPRKDLKQKDGNCFIVEVKKYNKLMHFARHVQETLNIKSVFNLEVFEIDEGKFIINEINVRFGGGIVFGALAGCDLVSYLVTKDKKYLGEIQNGVFSRYYEEVRANIS